MERIEGRGYRREAGEFIYPKVIREGPAVVRLKADRISLIDRKNEELIILLGQATGEILIRDRRVQSRRVFDQCPDQRSPRLWNTINCKAWVEIIKLGEQHMEVCLLDTNREVRDDFYLLSHEKPESHRMVYENSRFDLILSRKRR